MFISMQNFIRIIMYTTTVVVVVKHTGHELIVLYENFWLRFKQILITHTLVKLFKIILLGKKFEHTISCIPKHCRHVSNN